MPDGESTEPEVPAEIQKAADALEEFAVEHLAASATASIERSDGSRWIVRVTNDDEIVKEVQLWTM